jgi:ribosomal 50S subunit-recycling heat shock protein
LSEETSCRVDVWLWRARFFRSRSLAQKFVESGAVRLTRAGREQRLDKASRAVQVGDLLVFAIGARLVAVRVAELGIRRGPAAEASGLYAPLEPFGESPG